MDGHGVLALEHGDHHGARGHVGAEVLVERTRSVDGVEGTGLSGGEVGHARRDNLQAALLEAVVDIADDVLLDAVRLDDGNGAFDSHGNLNESEAGLGMENLAR